MKPIIYKSTDTGAPPLSASAGTMNAVIKACLVTGYGSKVAAGWDIVYEDIPSNKLAIRATSPKSIKSVLFLDDTANKKSEVVAYTEWNNTASTGVNNFGAGAFFKNMTGSGSSAKWVIVATDSFFYLWTQNDAGYNYLGVVSAFGDAISFKANTDISVLMALPTTATDTEIGTTHKKVFTSAGTNASFALSPFEQVAVGLGDRQKSGTTNTSAPLVFSQYVLYQNIGSIVSPELSLPGLLMAYTEVPPLGNNDLPMLTNQVPFTNPLVGLRQPYQGHVWIHTDDWG